MVVCPCEMDDCTTGGYSAEETREAMAYIATHCRENWEPGAAAWFEYHCNESPDSDDAPAWYRSHNKSRC